MIVSLIVVVLLLAVAFFQSTQGLFSALIMAVFSICCAAAAVGCHEWVAINFIAPYWRPDYSYAIALALLFGVPLIILRVVTDKLVRRSCHVHSLFDRLGGGLCGLITGYTVIGMIALALESMPYGGSLFGFERVPRTPPPAVRDSDPDVHPPDPDAKERDLWMSPDRFVVGLGAILSSGIFSGERTYGIENPDHIQHLGWVRSAPYGVPGFAPPRSISIVSTGRVASVYTFTPGGRNSQDSYDDRNGQPQAGHEFRMIRVRLLREARGDARSHFFTLRQFRLVGRDGSGLMTQYHPIAIQQADQAALTNRHIRYTVKRGENWSLLDDPFEPRQDNNGEVEVVFELPTGFVPAFLEYKLGARARVKFEDGQDKTEESTATANEKTERPTTSPPPSDGTASADDRGPRRRPRRPRRDGTVPDSGRGGRARGVTTLQDESFFGNDLPLELKDYRDLNNLEIRRGRMQSGHLVASLANQESGTSRPVKSFEVDRDKRLLQLNMKRLHARSGIGKALDFASRTVQNYFIEDSNGNQYPMIGEYAIATVDGNRTIEIQYFPEQAGTIGGLGAFRKIKDNDLKGDYELVLLFLVNPGATVTSFSAGGSAQRRDDLTSENLVAPN